MTIENTNVDVEYSDLIENQSTLKGITELWLIYGIALVRGVPIREGQMLEVCKRLAYVRETGFGKTFNLKQNLDPKAHLAYTGIALSPHTDLAYRERSPGVQMLHCLHSSDPSIVGQDKAGGQSFFIDGYVAAEWLRDNHPDHFILLCSTPVPFSLFDAERSRW
ncbi:uncharacterized protein LOC106463300 [Limulus polyphemus]|uniref:Uncharacterized protein LOC106463300 n=1 Tax=Limulus polyphemus TaxID=6850 RepID=A0ABM1BBP8_LIMPO|nr:uncharacterized protein LOC106463300 [Limulus polyphemus]